MAEILFSARYELRTQCYGTIKKKRTRGVEFKETKFFTPNERSRRKCN